MLRAQFCFLESRKTNDSELVSTENNFSLQNYPKDPHHSCHLLLKFRLELGLSLGLYYLQQPCPFIFPGA